MIFVAVRMHIEHQEIGSEVDSAKVNTCLPALGRSQTSFLDVQKAFYRHAQHHPGAQVQSQLYCITRHITEQSICLLSCAKKKPNNNY